MGYLTNFTVTICREIESAETLNENKRIFDEIEAKSGYTFCSINDTEAKLDEGIWSDAVDNVTAVAKKHPGVIIELIGEGEDRHGNWAARFCGNEYEFVKAETLWPEFKYILTPEEATPKTRYYQIEKKRETPDTQYAEIRPDELEGCIVFKSPNTAKKWLRVHGYDENEWDIAEYHDNDIDDPIFIDEYGEKLELTPKGRYQRFQEALKTWLDFQETTAHQDVLKRLKESPIDLTEYDFGKNPYFFIGPEAMLYCHKAFLGDDGKLRIEAGETDDPNDNTHILDWESMSQDLITLNDFMDCIYGNIGNCLDED